MSHIKIVPYDNNWPTDYLKLEQKLKTVLKTMLSDLIIQIDHIGSTSVEGLSAKDIIDIQVTVKNLNTPELTEKLVTAGFEYNKQANQDNLVGVDDHSPELKKLFFRYRYSSDKTAHIHIREKGRLNQQYPILFRDYLRSNKTACLSYQNIKIELATHFEFDSKSYYAIKDPVMDGIYAAAKIWKCGFNE
ncbi:MAG: GrpB family protein [Saccharospirillaceae bacterium]|nr:GrpB family protein [Pseudomonadales bacterium]NRB77563.1 GrpB family protein [Saccharospirillaceae bacterium]